MYPSVGSDAVGAGFDHQHSIGISANAAGAGLKVFIGQFVKGAEYSEIKALCRLAPDITIKQYGRHCFIKDKPDEGDIRLAQNGLREMESVIQSGDYDLVILDEANIAVYYNLFSVDELLKVVQNRPEQVEIVITGRKADPRIIAAADLVTEMREIKHYYQKGVTARPGIEM